jgi:hypothetical protein
LLVFGVSLSVSEANEQGQVQGVSCKTEVGCHWENRREGGSTVMYAIGCESDNAACPVHSATAVPAIW